MAKFESKYDLGDEVFGIRNKRKQVNTICIDCEGTGEFTLKSGRTQCCHGCHRGYIITWESTRWAFDTIGTVGDIRIEHRSGREPELKYMLTDTGCGQVWNEEDLCREDEVDAVCASRNHDLEETK